MRRSPGVRPARRQRAACSRLGEDRVQLPPRLVDDGDRAFVLLGAPAVSDLGDRLRELGTGLRQSHVAIGAPRASRLPRLRAARELRGRPVTIITSNLAVLDEVRGDDAVELVLLGGVLRRNQQSLVGPLAEQVLGQLSADVMFLSCTGVRGGRVLDNMAVEAPIKQAMIAASQRIVLLASELKFPGSGALRLCSLDEVDVLITTPGTPEEEISERREGGGKVIVA